MAALQARQKEAKMKEQQKKFDPILKRPENLECFECTSRKPTWASTNLGVIFCLRCAGIHRSLGTHISKVKSTKLDVWDEDMIDTVDKIGNGGGKLIYEAKLPSNFSKPSENMDTNEVSKILNRKYNRREWYADDADVIRDSLMCAPSGLGGNGAVSSASPAVASAGAGGFSSPSSGTGASNSNNNNVQWGDFSGSQPSTPQTLGTPVFQQQQQVPPQPQQQAAKKANEDDFWSSLSTPVSPPNSVASPYTANNNNSQLQMGTPVTSAGSNNSNHAGAGGVASFMDFGGPAKPSSNATAASKNDIMDAFKQQPAPQQHQQRFPPQQQQGGGFGQFNTGGVAATNNSSGTQWGEFTQSPVTQQPPASQQPNSLMTFGGGSTAHPQQPQQSQHQQSQQQQQGGYTRRAETKDILDMFATTTSAPPRQQQPGFGGGGYGGGNPGTPSAWQANTSQLVAGGGQRAATGNGNTSATNDALNSFF